MHENQGEPSKQKKTDAGSHRPFGVVRRTQGIHLSAPYLAFINTKMFVIVTQALLEASFYLPPRFSTTA